MSGYTGASPSYTNRQNGGALKTINALTEPGGSLFFEVIPIFFALPGETLRFSRSRWVSLEQQHPLHATRDLPFEPRVQTPYPILRFR